MFETSANKPALDWDRCPANPYGETHCWHWWNERPDQEKRYRATAACCWCSNSESFTFRDIQVGRVPISPAYGAVHGHYQTTVAASLIDQWPSSKVKRERADLLERLTAALRMLTEQMDRAASLDADLQALQSTHAEICQASNTKHMLIQEWREGIARIEHMAQAGQAYSQPGGPNSPLQQIIDEARRLRAMPA